MSYKLFNINVSKDYTYLLLSVYHKDYYICGSYYKGEEGCFITSILSGEKFYSLYEFVLSIKGLDMDNELSNCLFYNEVIKEWVPIIYL